MVELTAKQNFEMLRESLRLEKERNPEFNPPEYSLGFCLVCQMERIKVRVDATSDEYSHIECLECGN